MAHLSNGSHNHAQEIPGILRIANSLEARFGRLEANQNESHRQLSVAEENLRRLPELMAAEVRSVVRNELLSPELNKQNKVSNPVQMRKNSI